MPHPTDSYGSKNLGARFFRFFVRDEIMTLFKQSSTNRRRSWYPLTNDSSVERSHELNIEHTFREISEDHAHWLNSFKVEILIFKTRQ